jgi:hypothetical protein
MAPQPVLLLDQVVDPFHDVVVVQLSTSRSKYAPLHRSVVSSVWAQGSRLQAGRDLEIAP